MDPISIQDNLSLTISTPLGENVVILDSMEGQEGISMPFEFTLNLHANQIDLDFYGLLKEKVTVCFDSQDGQKRYFNGVVGKVRQDKTIITTDIKRAYYQIVIYPAFWLLTFSKDYRIFQNQSTLDIVKSLLKQEPKIEVVDECQERGQAERAYCVQYGESAFDFISRLLEEEGIYYYFKHEEDTHKMVLCDDSLKAKPIEGNSKIELLQSESGEPYPYLNGILFLNVEEQVVPSTFKSADYNYESAGARLRPMVDGNGLGGSVYEYPGLFTDMGSAEGISNMRIQELEWQRTVINGTSTVPYFSPGGIFTLCKHPRDSLNTDYFIYKVFHRLNQKGHSQSLDTAKNTPPVPPLCENNFYAFPGDVPFRPLRNTRKPRIYSNQTAVVTGPEGEEIFCDDYGRVKVQFHWDLRGNSNEESSCWVRVAQNWAGGGWGSFVMPRVNMEVVVTYIEGDPDRPLIIGCVYNSNNMPPYARESPTKTTLKSNSSKGGGGYNEIRFEDAAGSEEIYVQAQKDMNVLVKNDRHELLQGMMDILTMPMASKYVIQTGSGTQYTFFISNGNKSTFISSGNDVLRIGSGDRDGEIAAGNHNFKIGAGNKSFLIGAGNRKFKIGSGNSSFKIGQGNYKIKIGSGNYKCAIGQGNHKTKIGEGNWGVKIGTGVSSFKIGAGNHSVKIGAGIHSAKIGSGSYNVKIGAGEHSTKIGAGKHSLKIGAGASSVKIGAGNYSVKIGAGKHSTKIGAGTYSIKIGAGNLNIAVNGNISIKATGMISLKAGLAIKQKALKIDTKGLIVKTKGGLIVKMQAGISAQMKSLVTQSKGVITMIKGALVKIN